MGKAPLDFSVEHYIQVGCVQYTLYPYLMVINSKNYKLKGLNV